MSGVWINQKEYKGASAIQLALNSEVQKHPVEKGFAVADNIKHETPSFEVTLTLGGSSESRDTEYSALKELRDSSAQFTFICDLGSYDNMVIKSLSPAIERSKNTYSCSLTIMQIRVAELQTKYFTITDTDGTEVYSPDKPAGPPATQALQDKTVDNEPTKEPGKSWIESITDWIGGLF